MNHGKHGLKTRITQIVILLSVISYHLSVISFAQQTVSSAELIERSKELDGQEVVYQGEVVGELMKRGGNFWANVNDGENAVGIWLDNSFLNLISFCGDYNTRGDWLEVKGIFNRACKMHGGDLDIHGLSVTKIREGRLVKHRLLEDKQRIVIILLGVLLCLLILQLLKKRQRAK